MQIESAYVSGLHGRSDEIRLNIRNNIVIVIGANGLGKTTVLNIVYFSLTEQWMSLSQIDFNCLGLRINGSWYQIYKADIDSYLYDVERLRRRMPTSIIKKLDRLRGTRVFNDIIRSEELDITRERELANMLELPLSTFRRVRADLRDESGQSRNLFSENDHIASFSEMLRRNMDAKILYLPTYRRIEKELKHMQRNVDETSGAMQNVSIRHGKTTERYMEMVAFGMSDVEAIIKSKCQQIDQLENSAYRELVSDYLRKIINNQIIDFDVSVLEGMTEKNIDQVLNRVQDQNLGPQERSMIQETMVRLIENELPPSPADRYIGQLFNGLRDLASILEEREKPIFNFIKTVNENYLVDKRLEYRRKERTIVAVNDRESSNDDASIIDMRDLSSGEKQVISVFCHLYLGESHRYYVMIDEPELSLSIDWQEHFLSDIIDSGVCSFLFAVSHSPFTFSKGLRRHRIDLSVQSKRFAQ